MGVTRRHFLGAGGGAAAAWALGTDVAATESVDENPGAEPLGIVLSSSALTVRITDNTPRYIPFMDITAKGLSGIASLKHADQRKNIFSPVGMNYEIGAVRPLAGALADKWDAPRMAPMSMDRINETCVRLTQKGMEAAGLSIQMDYAVGSAYVDQTITMWPDQDAESVEALWASYMCNPQNTSLYCRGIVEGESAPRWLEVSRIAHKSKEHVWRSFDPANKTWDQHLVDNPILRQGILDETPELTAAARAAGFSATPFRWVDQFYYGLVDEFLFLMVFREPDFSFYCSPSGGSAKRQPAWDYRIKAGPQRADERRTYHARLVYKPFAGVDDVLREVALFQG